MATERHQKSKAAFSGQLGLILAALVLLSQPGGQRAQTATTGAPKVHAAYVLLGPSPGGESPMALPG